MFASQFTRGLRRMRLERSSARRRTTVSHVARVLLEDGVARLVEDAA